MTVRISEIRPCGFRNTTVWFPHMTVQFRNTNVKGPVLLERHQWRKASELFKHSCAIFHILLQPARRVPGTAACMCVTVPSKEYFQRAARQRF